MKYLLKFFAMCLFFTSCGGGQSSEVLIPEDLAGKKDMLKVKKQELRELNKLITELESSIDSLDPDHGKKAKKLVTTSTVGRTNFQHFVEIQGSVQADDLIDVTSETPGRITNLKVKEGDGIRKGQLVATLDLEALNKQIAELEKSLELANTVFERQSRLWEQNIGSEIQYLEAKNAKERLEKSLETLQFQLTKGNVYAPISGVVERVVLQGGELASPGMPIVQILNTNKLKVVANVPENYLRSVKMGEKVKVNFPALESEQDARVSLIGRTIDPNNRTFAVEASIPGATKLIKPNLLAIMLINDYSEEDVVTIPVELVQQEVGGKNYVYVKEKGAEGDIAKKVYVETGRSFNNEIVISSGLQGGEELIVEGSRNIANNELIKVTNSKTEANNG
jgi:RND family efflux transporter MFP subunit